MNTKDILRLLEVKNQNLPLIKMQTDFKNLPVIYIPVVQGEEKRVQQTFAELKKIKISGKKSEQSRMVHKGQIFHFIGLGKADKLNNRVMRRFYGSTYLSANGVEKEKIGFYCDPQWLKMAAIGIDVAALSPDLLKPKSKKKTPAQVYFIHPEFSKKKTYDNVLEEAHAIADGKNVMRLLGTMPPNILHPQNYAEIAMALAKKWKIEAKRINGAKLKDYGLINAVCAGSEHEPEILIFTVHPKKKGRTSKSKHATAVIGKGLCFDSGGNQDKGSYMKAMREDMGGSASVFGTLLSIMKGKMEVKETTHFVMALAENMSDSRAMRPDDVYTAGDGQTVEIIHTDAEGRLVLADAICYLKKHYKNIHRYYTIATLTGSCVAALGDIYTGSICNDEDLAAEVMKIGKETGDYVHVGPWDMEYDDNHSPIADVANLGQNQREAGWLKAGYFLYRFIPKNEKNQAQFCHFDIAGSIDMDEKGKSWRKKGLNSGACVTLLNALLRNEVTK